MFEAIRVKVSRKVIGLALAAALLVTLSGPFVAPTYAGGCPTTGNSGTCP